ncbi:unnamed protein product [Oikopleura dioica]|uniref:Uncharacterized protein n=1 Tax=Oikopleura dioica TaxID=34765 RepID=E4X182_OIKDI|nr:unnamed protein product [Oikopleura dioica]
MSIEHKKITSTVPGCQKAAESLLECAKNDEELKKILPKNLDLFGRKGENNFEKFASENPLVDFKRCFQQHVSAKQNGLSIRSKNPVSSQFISSKNRPKNYQRINFLSKIRSQKHAKLPKNILWNDQFWNTFQIQAHILGHLDQVNIITYDQTGKRIITGSDESLIKIWSAVTGMLLMTLRGHEGEINDLQVKNYAVHPDNNLLASCDDKKAIRIWCLRSGATVTCLMGQHTAHNITSISWGPGMLCVESTYIRPLVSTGNDGTVVFWSYDENDKSFILEAPPKFTERTKPGDRAVQQAWSKGGRLIAVGFSDGRIRVYMILKPDSPRGVDKIAELDVHTSCVSSIEFNQMQSTKTPPALLSTSFDGFAIIWRMRNRRWKVQKIDCVRETDQHADPKKRPKVNDGIWLKNDELICVALVGATHQNIIKIFNSATSDLVTTLCFHTQTIQNLKAHPKIPHVFASSGCDGLIVIWDVLRSKKIAEVYFPSTIESGEQMSIHDIRWSSDGTKIISADSQGHMSISGFGKDVKLSQLPDELFFETDYHPLIRDREGFVVDEQTGLTPHLQNPGMFTNSQNEPYLGRVNDDRTRRQMAEEGQRDVLGDRIRQLDLEMTAAEIDQAGEGGTPMNVDENSVHLDMSVLTFDVQRRSQSIIKKPSWCNKDFCEVLPLKEVQKRDSLQKKLSKAEERWFKKEGLDCDVMEIEEIHVTEDSVPQINSSQRRANRRRQRATDVEEPELPPESDEDHSIQGSDEEFNLNSSAEQRELTRVNRRRAPRGYVPVDDEPAEDDSDVEEASSSEESTTQENTSSEYVPTLEEPSTEANSTRSRRARTSREPQAPASSSRQRRKKRIILDESEGENEQANLDSSLEENKEEEQVPGPSSRILIPSSTSSFRKKVAFSESDDSDNSMKKSDTSSIDPLVQMSNSKKRNRRRERTNKRLSEDSSSNEPHYHSLIESPGRGHLQWIRQTQPLRCPFIPQIGDEVYYIPSAHLQFVKELENQKLTSLRKFHRVPTQFKNSSLMDMDILCVVEELEIELMNEKKFDPPARWCSISLKCIHDEIDLKKFTAYSLAKDLRAEIICELSLQESFPSKTFRSSPASIASSHFSPSRLFASMTRFAHF